MSLFVARTVCCCGAGLLFVAGMVSIEGAADKEGISSQPSAPMTSKESGSVPVKSGSSRPKSPAVPARGVVNYVPAENEKSVPQRFRLEKHQFTFDAESGEVEGYLNAKYKIHKVRFPSPVTTKSEANNTVHAEYFQPKKPGKHPGVVVLHILGGEFRLSRFQASELARRNIAALFVKMPYYGERRSPQSARRMISRDPHETAEGMTQAVLDIRRAAAWLAARPEVDANQLGVTGISLGGIMSALASAGEPRFRKTAIYLGGGNLGPILWDMPHPDAKKFRAKWLADGGSKESFLEALRPIDPVTYGSLLKNRKVLMVVAKNDMIVPPQAAIALWESIDKQPELVWLNAGHHTAALFILNEVDRIGRFFQPDEAKGKTETEKIQPARGTLPKPDAQ